MAAVGGAPGVLESPSPTPSRGGLRSQSSQLQPPSVQASPSQREAQRRHSAPGLDAAGQPEPRRQEPRRHLHSQGVRSPARFVLDVGQDACSEAVGASEGAGVSQGSPQQSEFWSVSKTPTFSIPHLSKHPLTVSRTQSSPVLMEKRKTCMHSRIMLERQRLAGARMPPRAFDSPLKTVQQVQKQVRTLVGQLANIWGWTGSNTKPSGIAMPQLLRVHSGAGRSHVIPGFLLQDLEGSLFEFDAQASKKKEGATVTSSTIQEVHLLCPTEYFDDITQLIKLRWMLRLQSACCELDYKVVSWKEIFLGMQFLALQQHSEQTSDSLFGTKVSQHVGAHLNLVSMLDDIIDQLQRGLCGSWQGFLEYVSTCDPMRSLCQSSMESRLRTPEVSRNDSLAVVLDTVFMAYFLRRPRHATGGHLRRLMRDLEALGIAPPAVPPLRGARRLSLWAKLELGLLHQQERAEAAAIRDLEKLAQLEALLLAAAVEMAVPAVTAERHDDEDGEVASPTGLRPLMSDVPPSPHLAEGSRGPDGPPPPPSSKVLYTTKPIPKREIFEASIYVVNFHSTFPSGIRERLHDVLVEEYSLTLKQLRRLTKSTTQSVNGPRLTQSALYDMEQHEKTRLRQYHADNASDTTHLLAPSLVPAEADIGKAAKYTTWTPPRSAPAALDRQPGGLIGDAPADRRRDSRTPFRVSKGTGPLTWSTELQQLRHTDLFFRMPPLA